MITKKKNIKKSKLYNQKLKKTKKNSKKCNLTK